jgi:hypothetical protein
MRRLRLLPLLAVAGLLVCAGPSLAAEPFQFQFSFDGSSLPEPPGQYSEFGSLAVNQATGNTLVLDGSHIDQFDPEGNPVNFPAVGSPQISVPGAMIAMNNSGGPHQGAFYVYAGPFTGEVRAFNPDGSPLGTGIEGPGFFRPNLEGGVDGDLCGGGVDSEGNLWNVGKVGKGIVEERTRYYVYATKVTPEGKPTGVKYELFTPNEEGTQPVCELLFDDNGNAYMATFNNDTKENNSAVERYDVDNEMKLLGETGLKAKYLISNNHFSIDPGTDELYQTVNNVRIPGSTAHPYEPFFLHVPYTDPAAKQVPIQELENVEPMYGFGFDSTGQTLHLAQGRKIDVFHREPVPPPRRLTPLQVNEVRSQTVVLASTLIPNNVPVNYHFEYGTTSAYGSSSANATAEVSPFPVGVKGSLSGLVPGTTYHVRLVATNSAGTTYGPDATFTTYEPSPGGPDPCPNALARKQTSARALPDCRAYELVSAPDSGGYDVESSIVPNQNSFPGYPQATDQVLYATHEGAIPGPWNATNKGPDPYVATRGAGGWTTNYEGLPANLNPAAGSFSSVLGEASANLSTLGFAGPGLCSPCFTSGLETGLPVRLPNGGLVQGMAGSLNPGVPSAKPEGKVGRYFSADGRYLAFASRYAFEPGANTGGDLTVYERDLTAGTTQIVSTDELGAPLTGTVSELGMSADGSRVVSAKRVAVDSAGNEYVIPYMHLAGTAASIDLAPGATDGVLFAGMTEDGSRVFFTTVDKLLPADTDSSADLYSATVAGGQVQLSLVSAGSSDACEPVSNGTRAHWNSVGAAANCDAVAIGGGGGVAASSGAVYFLSPAQLGGAGTLDQPNLYRADPGGTPQFVATLEPDNPVVVDSLSAAATRHTGDFQVSAQGDYAAFVSALRIGGAPTFELPSVFEYAAATGAVSCASCDFSGSDEASIHAPAALAPNGLSLLSSGEVFFTTAAQLILKDSNGRADIYSWAGGKPQLISAGNGPFDSGLLSASADGNDVFFFTHDDLAPEEDHNGTLIRIYDARVDGGFFKLPAGVPCAASDECHGPGTVAPGPPDIKSAGPTTRGNVLTCKANQVKKNGRCVRKPKKKHAKKHHPKKKHGKKAKHGKKTKQTKQGGKHA